MLFRSNGTTNARAHGWTTWVGQYHYTRARMTKWSDETEIFTDSMRQWGTDGTEAISPWYEMRPDLGKDKGMARTYYGY